MKGLIISDDSNVIDSLNKKLSENKFDTIIYRWLLKALDNIEEIRPDLVVVSASEYPRHWKTLAQYIKSGIGGENTVIVLLYSTSLSNEEKQKAETLGVKGFFSSYPELDLNAFQNILDENFNQKKSVTHSQPAQTENEFTVSNIIKQDNVRFDMESASLLFTNPKSKKMITGKVISYGNKTVEFCPEVPEDVSNLLADEKIDFLTFDLDGKTKNYTAKIVSGGQSLRIKLCDDINL